MADIYIGRTDQNSVANSRVFKDVRLYNFESDHTHGLKAKLPHFFCGDMVLWPTLLWRDCRI